MPFHSFPSSSISLHNILLYFTILHLYFSSLLSSLLLLSNAAITTVRVIVCVCVWCPCCNELGTPAFHKAADRFHAFQPFSTISAINKNASLLLITYFHSGSSRRCPPCLTSLTSQPMTASSPTLPPTATATLHPPPPIPKLNPTATKSRHQSHRHKVVPSKMGEWKSPKTIATTNSASAFPPGRNGPFSPSSSPSRCP